MNKILSVIFLLFTSYLFSQNSFNAENFKVTKGDLETKYDKDSNALIIYETGESETIKADRSIRFVFKQKLKILNKDGLDQANITVPLYHSKNKEETINNITATTYNLEGNAISKVAINPNNILYEKSTDNVTLVHFLPPNVKEGSVITYGYTIASPFLNKFKGWDFQDDIPKLYSQYTTISFANYNSYNIRLIGPLDLDKNEGEKCIKNGKTVSNCVKNTYAMKNIPAFLEEDFMSAKSNYLSRIDYEPFYIKAAHNYRSYEAPDWIDVDLSFNRIIESGKKLYTKSLFKKLLPNHINAETNTLKKAELIHKYVQEHYSLSSWSGEEDRFIIKNLIKNKTGSAFEINFLLFNLLKNSGIKVNPVILSTRENGLIYKEFPVISGFNYFIVQAEIENKTVLLDATTPYLSFGQIPFKCLNQNARLIDILGSWIPIKSKQTSTKHLKTELNFKNNTTLSGTITSKSTGYFALYQKKEFYSDSTSYYKNIENEHQSFILKKHSVNSKDKASKNFIQEFDIDLELETINDNIYIKPFLFEPITDNPFKLDNRTYPIDFGHKISITHIVKLNLNKNYSIINLPEDVTMQLPDKKGTLILSTTINENDLIVYFKFNLKEAIYQPHNYDYLKAFYNKIIDIQKMP